MNAVAFDFEKWAWSHPAGVTVHNMLGTVVFHGEFKTSAGIRWNLRDSQGYAIPSGVYLVTVADDYGIARQKITVMRK